MNVSPDNIFLTEDGRLKLGGFSFVTQTKIEGSFQNQDIHFTSDLNGMVHPDPQNTALEVLENKQQ